MHEITLETNVNGEIEIAQPNAVADDQIPIIMSPEQAEILAKWIAEAVEELRSKKQ